MNNKPVKVLMTATSYPRSETDWQGLFIRRIADAMGASPQLQLSLWAPEGPRHSRVRYACSGADASALGKLAEAGGIAHLLRRRPLSGLLHGLGLLRRLRRVYKREQAHTDIYHINWLQNALPLYGMGARAVITVLGTDFKLLKLPGMIALLRAVMKTNTCVLAPNASWMQAALEQHFGDVARVVPVNFGIEDTWYELNCVPQDSVKRWLCVLRITTDKIGSLFDWGEGLFGADHELHLFGPNQEQLELPPWVHYHGPVSAQELQQQWYPGATGFITLSQHAEGKPQVLLETMAAGLPVIASPIAAHCETIVSGEHGYLVNSCAELQQAMAAITDPLQRSVLSSNCRQHSQSHYGTWRDCLERYITLYGSLL